MEIIYPNWQWPWPLSERSATDYIIVHHTAGALSQTPADIWRDHIKINDDGIGYHRVITPDGKTYQGRPDNAIPAAAWGLNVDSVDIVLVGYFHPDRVDSQGNPIPPDQPTDAQLAALKDNINDLRAKYGDIPVIGHRQVADIINNPEAATACPGDVLFDILPAIVAQAEGKL